MGILSPFFEMRGNQLPVSAAGWQHGSQICYATFYRVKNHKIAKNSIAAKVREKRTDLKSFEFQKVFDVCLTKLKKYKFYLIKLATDLY